MIHTTWVNILFILPAMRTPFPVWAIAVIVVGVLVLVAVVVIMLILVYFWHIGKSLRDYMFLVTSEVLILIVASDRTWVWEVASRI